MITLNTERGLIKVDSWKEIEELPGFTINIDPKEYELKEIVGRYIFKDFIKCGLSSCHTPHGKGYIVTTKAGPITNIGQNCGKKHFGIEFEELSSKLEVEIRLKNYRDNIGSFLIFLDEYRKQLDDIRSGYGGADILYKKSQNLVKKTSSCPDEATTIISRLVRSRNPDIFKSRVASNQEVEDLEVIQKKKLPRPFYIDEKVGSLSGISFLYKENDLRDRLVLDLDQGFKSVELLDIDQAKSSDLKHWSGWVSEVERKLEEAKQILTQGITLNKKENLLQVEKAMEDAEQIKKYRSFVDQHVALS
jgi:hypothetical protein